MRILITGATGLLGTDLCRTLARRHHLIGWARRWKPVPGLEGVGIQGEPVDVTQPEQVDQGIRRLRPDLVIHSAALSDVDACEGDPALAHRVNAEAVGNVARSCASVGAFLLAISTDYVFDGTSRRPYREEDPVSPINVYGRTKWEGEQAAVKEWERCLVIRVSGLFGSARSNFVTEAAKRLRSGQPVPAVTDQVNSPSYTVDLAGAMERIVDRVVQNRSGARILHLANSGSASRCEVARWMARFLRAEESLVQVTRWATLNRPARRPGYTALDGSRYAQWVGAPLRVWSEALASFLKTLALDSSPVSW